MLTETIQLEVGPDVAKIYNDAPQTDKEKLQALFGSWMKQYAEGDVDSLKRSMDSLAERAQERGLTSEILEEILGE